MESIKADPEHYFDLGQHVRPVSTQSEEAQIWFDRGLNWTYAYNHAEAIACFEKAQAADPDCAMAYWGASYAMGPNYNLPWHLYDPKGRAAALAGAFDAMEKAIARKDNATPVERALIEALKARYPQRDPIDDMMIWNRSYTQAMRDVHKAFLDDLEVKTVFVEAIMNETPWQMWDLKTGGIAEGAGTAEARLVLETVFEGSPSAWDHPGLLHLYVHLMEMSPFPEKALRQADRLRDLMPDGGHLIHMPTHIDVQCGYYRDVLAGNERAIVADRKFLKREGALNVYTLYRVHNYHFAIYGAMFLGQFTPAMAAAEELIATTPEDLLRVPSPPMADFVEAYLAMKQHVLIRFGRWHDIIKQTLPEDRELYSATTAMTLYARALAHSALGNIKEAEEERAAFEEARKVVPDGRRVHNNTVVDLLEIASAMVDGELSYRKANYDVAFSQLQRAVELDDALPYDEPWGWMQPARHALGALLLEQGHIQKAEKVYREDLGLDETLSRACRHPGNIWALQGLYECLERRGEAVEIIHIRQQLDIARARAEIPVTVSCFCRRHRTA
ncbi:MAG: hypothetical protein AAGE61_06375 [Pseudomonadota bacterium]